MYYIASCSCGNDSMAMIYELVKRKYPLNEIVFYSNGMDFKAIYHLWEKVKAKFEPLGIVCTELKPDYQFTDKMFNILVKNRDGSGYHNGYRWCGGSCRWGTTDKNAILDKYCESKNATVYVGIAYDEQHRTPDKEYKIHPLKEWEYTQADCLKINRENGIEWLEQSDNGEWVDLYDILDRVSCWCCANKNLWELYNIWKYFPKTYWQGLKDMQARLDLPMKKFKNKKFGEYGNVFDLEKVFESGYVPKHRGKG